ncbi:MAG TPA: molybdate ABC transporter permease subunit [Agitococcus sp.]|nr:molybdate ABC transporter permease subunit [Agitococcus sp.]
MQLSPELLYSLWLTAKLALISTALLLLICIPLAYWLNNSRSSWVFFIEIVVTLPMVLPPTVIGFYLLLLFSPQYLLGQLWQSWFDMSLIFSFTGLVIGSVIYSLPFALQPIQTAFRQVDESLLEGAVALGANAKQVFWTIVIPVSRYGILSGAILSFAHTLGEFGVVLMLGGSIPEETRVASIALYDEVQKLNYPVAHQFALLLLVLSALMISVILILQRLSNHKPRIRLL